MARSKEYYWEPVLGAALPRVGVVVVHGTGGGGKSTLVATWSAPVTNGKLCTPWERAGTKRRPAGVLWLTSEEDIERLVIPRHEALGGDIDRFVVPAIEVVERDEGGRPIATDMDIENDLRDMLEAARTGGNPVRLVVCDTLAALVRWNGRNANSDADVKQVMARLRAIAEEHDCCIVAIAHNNKKADAAEEHRISGAQAWRESARLSWHVHDGFVIANKANDMPPMGCAFEQERLKMLYELPANDENGNPIQVWARGAKFTSGLMSKAKADELAKLAREAAAKEVRDNAPKTTRLDQMAQAAANYLYVLDMLGEEIVPRDLWTAVEAAYRSKPNSQERLAIRNRLGLFLHGNGPIARYVRERD